MAMPGIDRLRRPSPHRLRLHAQRRTSLTVSLPPTRLRDRVVLVRRPTTFIAPPSNLSLHSFGVEMPPTPGSRVDPLQEARLIEVGPEFRLGQVALREIFGFHAKAPAFQGEDEWSLAGLPQQVGQFAVRRNVEGLWSAWHVGHLNSRLARLLSSRIIRCEHQGDSK